MSLCHLYTPRLCLYSSLFFLHFFSCSDDHRELHSFPTRRSSDLRQDGLDCRGTIELASSPSYLGRTRDRKSTRLNSSHEWTSYAVFCLKKKKTAYFATSAVMTTAARAKA